MKNGVPKRKRSPTWLSWRAARQRCRDTGHSDYHRYGGRGITFDPAWDSFAQFVADMGERPEGMTLDRKRNSEGYSAENCRWATPSEQAKNRRPSTRDERGKFAASQANHQNETRFGG